MFFKKTYIEQLSNCAAVGGSISLDPLITYLKKILNTKGEENQLIPRFCLDKIGDVEAQFGPLNTVNLSAYEEVFKMIYSLQAGLRLDDKGLWALGSPLSDQVFYGTSGFYKFLEAAPQIAPLDQKTYLTSIRQLLYGVILQRFYNIPVSHGKLLYQLNEAGLIRYYELQVDFSFVDIQRDGDLPAIDLKPLRDKEEYCMEDLDPIFEALEIAKFTFSGFTILSVEDKTIASLCERLQSLTADLPQYNNKQFFFDELNSILSIATGSPSISASLLPVLELNGYPILSSEFTRSSIFFQEMNKRNVDEQMDPDMVAYLAKPYPIIYGIETSFDTDDKLFNDIIKHHGLASYVHVPLRQQQNLVGFLEIYSYEKNQLTKMSATSWKMLVPSLTHLASEIVAVFKSSLERIILTNFTSLNPAVEWRFNEVAAQHISNHLRGEPQDHLEKVRFEKVYPIYGAIDVKDSTRLRNEIYRQDNLFKIKYLDQFLQLLPVSSDSKIPALLAKRTEQVRAWLESDDYERFLLDTFLFLHEDLFEMVEAMKKDNIIDRSTIEQFVHQQKRIGADRTDIFETSLQQLNGLIKEEVNSFNHIVQEIFPSYFEIFRSDGIEYDMYVGQSITPTKTFQPSILHEIRKHQLISMARIGQRAAEIKNSLAVPMQVTLLIFIHTAAIDISFRDDERRFDVEGGYNIRYQMVKKRIDKVHIKSSHERLVQPNTVAIVFQGETLESEIKKIVHEVVEMGLIVPSFELLDLEEIQGVNELRAVRAAIALTST